MLPKTPSLLWSGQVAQGSGLCIANCGFSLLILNTGAGRGVPGRIHSSLAHQEAETFRVSIPRGRTGGSCVQVSPWALVGQALQATVRLQADGASARGLGEDPTEGLFPQTWLVMGGG